ncbi:MAG TPA: site-specific integrase, partial [Nitrospiraceae bacterium]|nr:site-specific integrase [Nitrospiraceae bacterium]
TINRELEVLTKMMRLGYENHKVARIPIIRQLKEAAPRSGFFERRDFESVRRQLRVDLQVAICIAYTYGWRVQSEVLSLSLAQVDLEAGTLRLDPGSTKNEDARVVYLTADLKTFIAEQMDRVKALSKKLQRIIPHLFPHLTGRHIGERIQDFRKAWATACKKVGLPGMLRHDCRRTAVRNLVNAGVSERVAMKITGHRTREVFDRYHIVSPSDLQEASRKLSAPVLGTISGTPKPAVIDPPKLSVR